MAKTRMQPVPISDDRMLSTTEVATLLGVTGETVRSLINRGRLPSVRVTRSHRVRQSDLERFIKQNTIGG